MLPAVILVLVFVPMLAEARRSARNERLLRAAGATEPKGDVYPATAVAGGIVFVAAKGLKYWAIATLGTRWTFRVLVPRSSRRTVTGPYRILRHPNYVAVAGELIGVALMAQAVVTGPIAVVAFTGLMLARIRVEERALGG